MGSYLGYYTHDMSGLRHREVSSSGAADTESIAYQIGKRLRGGEVIELVSDVGGGKTTFTRGLAAGLGIASTVHSPSFTISNQYDGGKLTLYHFDFYRLAEAGIVKNELSEVLLDNTAVVVIEWAQIVEDVLPKDRLSVTFRVSGESTRRLNITYPDSLQYLTS